MPKKPSTNSSTALNQLAQLEAKKNQLIEARNNELLAMIHKYKAITIDDSLFAGFLLFATDPVNKDDAILTKFKEVAKARKAPSRIKKPNSK